MTKKTNWKVVGILLIVIPSLGFYYLLSSYSDTDGPCGEYPSGWTVKYDRKTNICTSSKDSLPFVAPKKFETIHGLPRAEKLCQIVSENSPVKYVKYDMNAEMCLIEFSTGSYQLSQEWQKYDALSINELEHWVSDDKYKTSLINFAFSGGDANYSNITKNSAYFKRNEPSFKESFMSGSAPVSDKEGAKLCDSINSIGLAHRKIVGKKQAKHDMYSSLEELIGISELSYPVTWIGFEKTNKLDENGENIYERPKFFDFQWAKTHYESCYFVFVKQWESPSESKNNYYSISTPLKFMGEVHNQLLNTIEQYETQYMDNKPYNDDRRAIEGSLGVRK